MTPSTGGNAMKVFISQHQADAYAEHCRRQGKVAAIIERPNGFVVRWADWQRPSSKPPRGRWRDVRSPLRIRD
jgi:hypothetical protein